MELTLAEPLAYIRSPWSWKLSRILSVKMLDLLIFSWCSMSASLVLTSISFALIQSLQHWNTLTWIPKNNMTGVCSECQTHQFPSSYIHACVHILSLLFWKWQLLTYAWIFKILLWENLCTKSLAWAISCCTWHDRQIPYFIAPNYQKWSSTSTWHLWSQSLNLIQLTYRHVNQREHGKIPCSKDYDSYNGTTFLQIQVSRLHGTAIHNMLFVCDCGFWCHQTPPFYAGIPLLHSILFIDRSIH